MWLIISIKGQKRKVAQMSEEDRAMCWALRNPPRGGVKVKLADIRKMLKKKDGRRPGLSAIGKAAKTYKDKKEKRGEGRTTRKEKTSRSSLQRRRNIIICLER